MEFEFETEGQEPAKRLETLISIARDSLRRGDGPGASSYVDGIRVDSSDISQDLEKLQRQESRLAGEPAVVVGFPGDATALGRGPVDVPVDMELPRQGPIEAHVIRVFRILREAGLRPRFAKPAEAREAFLDRAAESIGLRAHESASGTWRPNISMVSSTMAGDNILCAKGWFFSTGAIVGQSTCPVSVLPGRYSLGVSRGSRTRYHEHLFDLPIGSIHLELP